jgi:hypothetical protein
VRAAAFAAILFIVFASNEARADEADEARQSFREGAALVEQSEWAAALAAFERSRSIREHALTLYNIGVCQRYLGRYTVARATLAAALERNGKSNEMPSLFVEQAQTYQQEVESKLARLVVTLAPPSTRMAVEGKPLTSSSDHPGTFVSGIAESGEGRPVDRAHFEVLVDPRPIVLTFSLPGYDTIELRRTPSPGGREELLVSMAEQPAQLKIESNVRGAVVRVDGVDVGLTPVNVTRPPGIRFVSVTMNGYVPYESKLPLRPGQVVPVDARLNVEKVPITKKWWFWAASAVALAGVGLTTYFVVRPEPDRPAPEVGGLGWLAEVR